MSVCVPALGRVPACHSSPIGNSTAFTLNGWIFHFPNTSLEASELFFSPKFLILRSMESALLWPVKEVPVIIATPRSSSQDLIGFYFKKNQKTSFHSGSESFCRPTLFSPPCGCVALESSVIKLLNWSINHQKLGGVKEGELSATTSAGFTPNMALKLKTRSWA